MEPRPVNSGADQMNNQGSDPPQMWWHLIPRLTPVLTGQDADKHLSDRRVLWAACAGTVAA
jgi:hypothetical protein